MTNIPSSSLPDLLSRERFIRLAAHVAFHNHIVGDKYAVLVLEVDQLDLIRARHGAQVADRCAKVITRRFQEAMPSDAIGTELREDAYGMMAFGAGNEASSLALADRLHDYMRTPIDIDGRAIVVSVSVGIAFTKPGVRAIDALRASERAVIRVRQNGGDATFVARVAPPVRASRPFGVINPDRVAV